MSLINHRSYLVIGISLLLGSLGLLTLDVLNINEIIILILILLAYMGIGFILKPQIKSSNKINPLLKSDKPILIEFLSEY